MSHWGDPGENFDCKQWPEGRRTGRFWRRRVYLPTERGIGLIPVLIDLVVWGNANTPATGAAEVAQASRIDRDAVIRQFEARVRESIAGKKA